MQEKAGNFDEGIHLVEYEEPFRAKLIEDSSINQSGRQTESLNGSWHYAIDQYDTCLRTKWFEERYESEQGLPYPVDFSFDNWETMQVPSCWNVQSELLHLYEGPMVFTRRFVYQNHGEDRVFIKIGAANYQATVFVNKQYMGMHLGGSTPFCVEVTDVLEKDNRILVVVNNTRRRTNLPCENTDWFNYGGIHRDVTLLRLPKTFIEDFKVHLVPDDSFNKISAAITLNGSIKDGLAKLSIPDLKIAADIQVKNGKGSITLDASPQLWSPQTPHLYEVKVTFGEDSITEQIGFRQIRAVGDNIYLNGKEIHLCGVSAHEESVENGRAVTDEEIRKMFAQAKAMNCNFMRLAHYPHTERAAQIADEMGLLLWEEIPVYWAIAFANPDTYRDAENQLTELINRDYNRASVIFWSVGNENADTDDRLEFMSRLIEKTKEIDSTRLVSAACLVDHQTHIITDRLAAHVDVIGINEYYGWYNPDFKQLLTLFEINKPGKPVIISEFGADAPAGMRGSKDELFTEDHQLYVYQRQIDAFLQAPNYLVGTTPWIFFDFRCPRRTHFMQGYYNRKGLLSADLNYRKLAFYAMKDYYAMKISQG